MKNPYRKFIVYNYRTKTNNFKSDPEHEDPSTSYIQKKDIKGD